MESTYFYRKILILTSSTRVLQPLCAYTCTVWLLKTFPAYQKTYWKNMTIGGGKRHSVNMNRYLDVWQSSNIFLILWLSGELLLELLQLLRTIV